MEFICTIPARLGSKRIPRKNLRSLAGRPLIAWTIEVALKSNLFNAVYVCTESEEIASVARKCGAAVPELVPGELCGDLEPSWKPCVYVAKRVSNGTSAAIVCLQPTSPFRSAADIQDGIRAFQSPVDSVVSVTEIDPHFFHWALEHEEERWRMVFGKSYLKERPLLPPRYRPNGSIKIARIETLEETGHFFSEKLKCVATPEERSIHIGSEFDFKFAESLAGVRNGKEL